MIRDLITFSIGVIVCAGIAAVFSVIDHGHQYELLQGAVWMAAWYGILRARGEFKVTT